MKYLALLFVTTVFNCSGQYDNKIVGKWTSNHRAFVSSDDKNKVLKTQKLSFFETFEFQTGGKGVDWTIEGHPEYFNYRISGDTLYFGRFIALVDTLTATRLVYTRLDAVLKKPELRQFFNKTK